jgi:hypothetical protein
MKSLTLLFLTFLVAACGPAPKMPEDDLLTYGVQNPIKVNDIEIFDFRDSMNFASLPLQADTRDGLKYWSGDYWPFSKGSINIRWNAYTAMGTDREAPDFETAKLMTYEDLAQLSPSEKFDLLNGNYDYPLTSEVKGKADPEADDWEGICNGWATASIYHAEPKPKDLVNPEGITIPFGSSDIKALISYYYAFHHQGLITHHIGTRCENNGSIFGRIFGRIPPECKVDVNPGSFHLALANTIGLRHMNFLMDLKRYKEVWNHPIVAYTSEVESEDLTPGEDATPGTNKTLRIKTTVTYVTESDKNTWYPINGTTEQLTEHESYDYLLYLNREGNVIGGKWKSEARPDFIWRVTRVGAFQSPMETLASLMND